MGLISCLNNCNELNNNELNINLIFGLSLEKKSKII